MQRRPPDNFNQKVKRQVSWSSDLALLKPCQASGQLVIGLGTDAGISAPDLEVIGHILTLLCHRIGTAGGAIALAAESDFPPPRFGAKNENHTGC